MVYLKAVLPNPAGRDANGEWIKLINNGESSVNTTGWVLKDASGKSFSLTSLPQAKRILAGGEELVIRYDTTGISLNNNGDTVSLYNNIGKLVNEISYSGPVADDEIIFSSRFIPKAVSVSRETTQLQNLAFTGQGVLTSTQGTASIFIAIAIAIISSVGIGLFVKDAINKKDQHE